MKLTFLGTGTSQGIPAIACECEVCQSVDFHNNRMRSSVLFDDGSTTIVIDTGPDFRMQMLSNRVKKLDAVLYTHEHKDHTAGLDDIRSFNFKQKMDMPLFGRPSILTQLRMEFAYIFNDSSYPGVPRVIFNEIENKPFKIRSMDITPIEVMHYKLPVFGFITERFAYITDAKTISEEEKKKLINLEVLVLNALQKTEHISHFTLQEALDLIAELKPKKAYLTHIGHNLGLHKEVQAELPENVFLAYDGLVVQS